MTVCLHECLCATLGSTHRGQKRVSVPLGLELQAVVSLHVDVLALSLSWQPRFQFFYNGYSSIVLIIKNIFSAPSKLFTNKNPSRFTPPQLFSALPAFCLLRVTHTPPPWTYRLHIFSSVTGLASTYKTLFTMRESLSGSHHDTCSSLSQQEACPLCSLAPWLIT